MHQISLADAKQDLQKLVQDVQKGEEIIIIQNEKPVAKLISVAESESLSLTKKTKPGSAKGLIKISVDFDEPLESSM